MALDLTKPAIGSTGWGADVNENFGKIENDGFGSWDAGSPYAVDTVYGPASTDGFVVGWAEGDVSGANVAVAVKTDGSDPPERIRQKAQGKYGYNHFGAFCVPVRKGDRWKVEVLYSFGSPATTIFWLPART